MTPEPRKDYGCTTQGEKIDSRAVSGVGMGTNSPPWPYPKTIGEAKQWDEERARRDQASVAQPGSLPPDAARDQALRDALSLLMAELPGLLEDREKLRKLREVLG